MQHDRCTSHNRSEPAGWLDTDKIESVIDTIEQKVKEAIPYVNPSKVYVEIRQDIFSDSYRR
jgi:hypothetical protein